MRVTNIMTHNKSLNNIHRNMRHLQRIYEKTTSQKIINRPSQNPLIASRSLRFRDSLSTVEQHQRNVESGHGWMNVTESAFFNLLRGDAHGSIFGQIKDEFLRAANNPTGTLDDVLVMVRAIENLMHQASLEMNQTHLGRFVFAGWRTDQPPVLTRPLMNEDNVTPASHIITQTFNVSDIERAYSFQRFPPGHPDINDITGMPVVRPVNIFKLPYRDRDGGLTTYVSFGPTVPARPTPPGTAAPTGPPAPPALGIERPPGSIFPPINVVTISLSDIDAFNPPNDGETMHFIPETGELVFGNWLRDTLEDGLTMTYEVRGLQAGDLNPFVYFDTHSTVARQFENIGGVRTPLSFHWPQAPEQAIHYEFHHRAPTQVNSLARNVYTDMAFADLRNFIDFVRNISPPDRRELEQVFAAPEPEGKGLSGEDLRVRLDAHIADEWASIRRVLNNRIDNMIRLMDIHSRQATREHTDLGTRMRRVEMFENRLEQDEGNISVLKSENEDVDMTWALIQQAIAEASYQQALRVIANNIQLSLVNFV